MQQVGQRLGMTLDLPAIAVRPAALHRRDLRRQVRHQHDFGLAIPRRFVELQHDPPQAVHTSPAIGDVDRLLEDLSGCATSARPKSAGRLKGQGQAMPADQEERLAAYDPEDQRTHAEVAVHDPELAAVGP